MHAYIARAQVAAVSGHAAPRQIATGAEQGDPGADVVAVAFDALKADAQRAGRRADLVEEQPGGL
jgi:hypothetical protein